MRGGANPGGRVPGQDHQWEQGRVEWQDQGQTIRLSVAQIRVAGRATQGVTLFRLGEGERVVSVERIGEGQEIEGEGEGEEPKV